MEQKLDNLHNLNNKHKGKTSVQTNMFYTCIKNMTKMTFKKVETVILE